MGFEMGCQKANHSRAIRGAAVPCGESPGVFSEDGVFRWCTTAAHNPARRLAGLAGSFGGSRRPRLPGNVAPPAQKKLRSLTMDLVRLYGVYQVHLPCLRSPFGAYPVDLVQALKVDLVHPTFPPGFPT